MNFMNMLNVIKSAFSEVRGRTAGYMECEIEYMGIKSAEKSEIADILLNMVSAESTDIFMNADKFMAGLELAGLAQADIYRLLLMTRVTGFEKIIGKESNTSRADIDIYVRNAVIETGLNRDIVMKLTRDIALAAGVTVAYSTRKTVTEQALRESIFTVPASLYKQDLKTFSKAFHQTFSENENVNTNVNTLDFSLLEPLVTAGITKAKTYMGWFLLNGVQLKKNPEKGLMLLREAAEAGDCEAAAALGDYYYENNPPAEWGKAHEYYTGFGAAALNNRRKSAITNIFNHKKYNARLIMLNILFIAAMFWIVIAAQGDNLFAGNAIFGILCMVINVALLIRTCLHYRIKPYDTVYLLTIRTFVIWIIWYMSRIIF